MRSRCAFLLTALLAFPVSAETETPAADSGSGSDASVAPGDHYIDVLGSFVSPDSGRNTKSRGYGGSVIYGAHLDGPLWIEGYLSGDLLETGGDKGTDFYHYGAGIDLVGTYGDRRGFTPFALVGIGAVHDDVQPDRDDGFNFRANAGIGVISPMLTSRGLKLRAEGRALYDSFDSGQLDWKASIGISIPLGHSEVIERVVVREKIVEVPAAYVPDADFDGVLDRFDQCPGTLPDADVDKSGCLIEGQTIILDDVHFEHDSSTLTKGAEDTLDQIATSLRFQPEILFEIAGHTDSTGSDGYNDRLSQARANSVVRFLTGRGIETERMSAHGYGERQPIDTNDSAEGRARNRRVEFRIHARKVSGDDE